MNHSAQAQTALLSLIFSLSEVLAFQFFKTFSLQLLISYLVNCNLCGRLSKMLHLIFLIFAFQPLLIVLSSVFIIVFLNPHHP